MKVLTVVGARPQFIKAAPVSRAFAAQDGIQELLVHTGQHFDANMSDIFFEELGIPSPTRHLGIGGGGHGQNTGRMIEALEQVMLIDAPDWVLVYGDTDSTLAGAVAAAKLNIPVAHVEAGLRSHNMTMPEEVNRRLTDHVSALLFTPTEQAVANLMAEGISGKHVHNVGDVMYDASLLFSKVSANSTVLDKVGVEFGKYILTTVHRKENTDVPNRLSDILSGLSSAPVEVVFPLHPRTRRRIAEFGLSIPTNVIAIDPVGYLDMVALQRGAMLVATDSGGVQKEAYFHRTPCLTLRGETEWVELLDMGWNKLVRPGVDDLGNLLSILPAAGRDDAMPYGNGDAASKIVAVMVDQK